MKRFVVALASALVGLMVGSTVAFGLGDEPPGPRRSLRPLVTASQRWFRRPRRLFRHLRR